MSFLFFFRADNSLWWLPPAAILLDMLLADPKSLPHPVQGIAFLASRLERPARLTKHLTTAGALVMLALLLLIGTAVMLLTNAPYGLGHLAALYFSWAGLALGSLVREASAALRLITQAIHNADMLPEARRAVQMLVSRDTDSMDGDTLCRSLAESVSENINDAFVAPFFWLLLTGPVGLWLYKCASTMDSMWGYRNERWLFLGRAAARLDDILAWIPARLTAVMMLAAAWLVHIFCLYCSFFRNNTRAEAKSSVALRAQLHNSNFSGACTLPGWPGWSTVISQARLSASPNAGWPMAVAAWLFNGKTGGATPYHGQMVQKPFMGPQNGCWTVEGVSAVIRHAVLTGMLTGILGTILFWTAQAWLGAN
jgi:adenosylcobinamide-phosphate synthase